MTSASVLLASGIASLTAMACASSTRAPAVERATGEPPLSPDARGWVDESTTGTTGIQGQWRAFGGETGARSGGAGACETEAFGECSSVFEPVAGLPYAPTPGLGMCTSGIIARWIANSNGLTPDGSPGSAGIVFDLNVPDWPGRQTSLDAPPGQAYDADARGVRGFSFDIDSEPPAGSGMSVEVTSVGPDMAWPATTVARFRRANGDISPVHAGHNEFVWDDLAPDPFDASKLVSIAFLARGTDASSTSYGFCIDHLTALRSDPATDDASSRPRPVSVGQLLVPDESGWVDRSTTGATKIQGFWFAYSDGDDPGGTCHRAGYAPAECSVVTQAPGNGSVTPSPDLGICTAGIAARIVAGSDGEPDYHNIWGGAIALDLNGVDPPETGSARYNATVHGVTGFAFDIDSEPPPGAVIQVQVAPEGAEASAPWWGGEQSEASPVHAGHNEFRWGEVGGPSWQDESKRVPLDPTRLWQLRFQVTANDDHAVSYGFCINHLMALED